MDKKSPAITAIIIIVVAGIGVVFFFGFIPQSSTSFHYAANNPEGTGVLFQVRHIQDCEVNISFQESETLIFSIDIELYEEGIDGTDFLFYYRQLAGIISLNYLTPQGDLWDGKMIKIKSLTAVFGTGLQVGFEFWECHNLTTSIDYSNGALLGKRLEYYANGTLNLSLDETANTTYIHDSIHIMEIGTYGSLPDMRPSSVFIDIDLPDSVHGYADFNDAIMSLSTIDGWVCRGGSYYSTDEDLINPRISIHAIVDYVSGNLVN